MNDFQAKERSLVPAKEQAYQRRIAELEAENAALKARVARIEQLVAKLSKNSFNSSKPPSSDIVKPPKHNGSKRSNSKRRRKIGGQPGHAKHDREAFGPDEIDDTRQYELCGCPDCGGRVGPQRGEARVAQQVELTRLTLPGKREQVYAKRLLNALRKMFVTIHRRDTISKSRFEQDMTSVREAIIQAATWVPPRCKQARNLAKRLTKHGDAYFKFITTPGVEPTNNLAEQAIRFCVIDRKITQGTRGQPGRRWCERIWTVVATCAQQGRSVFQYLRDAVHASLNRQPIPTLNLAGP